MHEVVPAVQPIRTVIVVDPEIADPVVRVILGELIDLPPEQAAAGLHCTAADPKLLKAKVLADGEAVLFADPGNVITIVPPLGIFETVVNLTV